MQRNRSRSLVKLRTECEMPSYTAVPILPPEPYPVSRPYLSGPLFPGIPSFMLSNCMICRCCSLISLIGPLTNADSRSLMLKASTMADIGPAAGPPAFLYGSGEKAKMRRQAKMGISQARMSAARLVSRSSKVIYLEGFRMPRPVRMEMMNCNRISIHGWFRCVGAVELTVCRTFRPMMPLNVNSFRRIFWCRSVALFFL